MLRFALATFLALGAVLLAACSTLPLEASAQPPAFKAEGKTLRQIYEYLHANPELSFQEKNSSAILAAEMKRLYVRQAFRGLGLGRQLTEGILDAARKAGYSCVLLDTLDDMESARALYEDLGFEEIPPYYHNPHAGAHYLKVDID